MVAQKASDTKARGPNYALARCASMSCALTNFASGYLDLRARASVHLMIEIVLSPTSLAQPVVPSHGPSVEEAT